MSLKKILMQKLRNPKTREWIETSYIAVDDATSNEPVIYMHGTLADDNVIESRHIQSAAIKKEHIDDGQIENRHLEENIINQYNLQKDAVVRDKIYNEAVNSDKLAPNAVTLSKLSPEVRNFITESSDSVIVSEEEPSNENTKIWIRV